MLPPGLSLDFISKTNRRQGTEKLQRPKPCVQKSVKKTTAFTLIAGLGHAEEDERERASYTLPTAPKNEKILNKKISSANKRTNLRIVNDQISECNRTVRELQAQVDRNPNSAIFKKRLQLASDSLNSLKRSAAIMSSALKATKKPFKF